MVKQARLCQWKRIFYGVGASQYDWNNNKAEDSQDGPLRLNTGKYGGCGRRK
jgi:hypothetical protein